MVCSPWTFSGIIGRLAVAIVGTSASLECIAECACSNELLLKVDAGLDFWVPRGPNIESGSGDVESEL